MRDHLVDHDDWKRAERQRVREAAKADARATEIEVLEAEAERMGDPEIAAKLNAIEGEIARIDAEIDALEDERHHKETMAGVLRRALEDD